MRDHGGNLDAAMARHGGTATDWLDLSTGINPRAYPLPALAQSAWTDLPTRTTAHAAAATAAQAYGTDAAVLPTAGAQAIVQAVPRLRPIGRAAVLTPTYNEHAGALRQHGWTVTEAGRLDDLTGAEIAVVVNPNNPDGRRHDPASLLDLAHRVGLLVVDESFCDVAPELSLAPYLPATGTILVLRSFGKFFGLAGVRLGFALGGPEVIGRLESALGPWPVSGPALHLGRVALADTAWQADTRRRLRDDVRRLDRLAQDAGWHRVGGTDLFRLFETPDAALAQERLARHRIWSRIFPYSATWLRLGLPDGADPWARVETAFADLARQGE